MTAQQRLIRMYDRALENVNYHKYFEDSGYFNFGYWGTDAKSQREACDSLIDHLVGRIGIKGGRILDVACGPGGSTKRLTRYYEPENITAINISEAQLAEARERAPGCTFLRMDATCLDFPDNHFDAVMCVEAAMHFNTRERFFSEALRVVKPGGSLVLTDILFQGFMRPIAEFGQVPVANFLPDIAGYRERLEAAGFEGVSVHNATEVCLRGFCTFLAGWPAAEHRKGHMSWGKSAVASVMSRAISTYFRAICKTYLIASAHKPFEGAGA